MVQTNPRALHLRVRAAQGSVPRELVNSISFVTFITVATKTLTASVDPDLYRRAREAARAAGQAQSTVVAEALSLYIALPEDVRAVLRRLAPEAAARLLQGTLARGLWDEAVERWRASLPAATRRELAKLSDAEIMARAIREVAQRREPKH